MKTNAAPERSRDATVDTFGLLTFLLLLTILAVAVLVLDPLQTTPSNPGLILQIKHLLDQALNAANRFIQLL
jgi:hypothetical protein